MYTHKSLCLPTRVMRNRWSKLIFQSWKFASPKAKKILFSAIFNNDIGIIVLLRSFVSTWLRLNDLFTGRLCFSYQKFSSTSLYLELTIWHYELMNNPYSVVLGLRGLHEWATILVSLWESTTGIHTTTTTRKS